MQNYNDAALDLHRRQRGKWEIRSKVLVKNIDDLSVAYTPGVAAVCSKVADDLDQAYKLTMKGNSVAVLSDGTAVLGLGNIGPEGALPVMEGKAILFKRFARIDGVPIVVNTSSPDELIAVAKAIAPTFGGINLEDISAPNCFYIEEQLQDIGIPVFHDDQHGTAIVVTAALINAAKVSGKNISDLNVVINGAGAAGTAIAKMLVGQGSESERTFTPVKNVIICDRKGIISQGREGLNSEKEKLLTFSNTSNMKGDLRMALKDADVFIGVSQGNLLTASDIKLMAKDPIILALANPIPEIMPDAARAAGAAVIGTGRSDFPNQVNNVLAFPGIFRGALDACAPRITNKMKYAASMALARCVPEPTADVILPNPFDEEVAPLIARAVKAAV